MFRFLRISDTTTETASDAVQIVFGLDPGYMKYVLTADAHRILELAAANEIGAAVTWQFIRDEWAALVSARGASA